jgi:hypothetical protein
MDRREFARILGLTAGTLTYASLERAWAFSQRDEETVHTQLERLKGEPPARAEIRTERGGVRLYLNGREVYPMMASSTQLYPTIENFAAAGIVFIHPILSLMPAWLGPGKYDWSMAETFLARLLELYPGAYFLPRMSLNTPDWWKDAHPEELIMYGLSTPEDRYDVVRKRKLSMSEGGFYYGSGGELREASFASERWRTDTGEMFAAFLKHMESTPLVSRLIGYHPTWGTTQEWNYYGEDFLPDTSGPMQRVAGPIPEAEVRMKTSFGLLRDPEREGDVIRFYQRFHRAIGETVLAMARVVKEATNRRALCGVFYAYVTEIPRIQEGGYQAAEQVLGCPDIDYFAAPYCYQPGNTVNAEGVRVTMVDGAENRLGHPRGVAGDGGYRIPLESLRRRGKLFVSEMDPSTYLDASAYSVIGGHGGLGSDTLEGSLRILQRDLGKMFACGVGGWLLDFGPLNKAPSGWYAGDAVIGQIKQLVDLGKAQRPNLDIGPVAEICVVEDVDCFHASAHWKAGSPWTNYGIKSTDYINHWFVNTQSRAIHRMGAPFDGLYRFDLTAEDARKYRLLLVLNAFFLSPQEAERIRMLLRESGCTVVWLYAPGFVSSERLDKAQMERLTGFSFTVLEKPGTMMMKSVLNSGVRRFGVNEEHFPRFVPDARGADVLGEWEDGSGVGFAVKEYEGHASVYAGTAPIPAEFLRMLAERSGVRLWSSRQDIVFATQDAAMIVATEPGKRSLTLSGPMSPAEGGAAMREHTLEMEYGEVRIFHSVS